MVQTDEKLYEMIEFRDKEAFKTLYRKYEKLLFSYAYKMTSDTSISEEVVQDVFMKVWQKKGAFKPDKGRLSTWLITLTRNSVVDQLRKKKVDFSEYEERDSMTESDKNAESPTESKVIQNEDSHIISTALKNLSTEQQQMIELFYFRALTQSQISNELNLPLGTVKSRLRLALKHLKKHIKTNQKGGIQNDNA